MEERKKAKDKSPWELARYIDHSVLKPEFSLPEVRQLIQEGIAYGCSAECVQGCWVDLALALTKDTETKVAACIGFPQGVCSTKTKLFEAEEYAKKGVFEIDMVANFGWLRSGMYQEVEDEIRQIADLCHSYGIASKDILEVDVLTKEQIIEGTRCVINAGADFVKTSTGFITGTQAKGATLEVIDLIQSVTNGQIKIKAAGGVRTREHFLALIDKGVERIGIGYKSMAEVLGIDQNGKQDEEKY